MTVSPFPFSKAFADLKDFLGAHGEKPLHGQLRGGLEKVSLGHYGINVGFGDNGRAAKRSFHLQVSLGHEKIPCVVEHKGSCFKVF